MTTKSRETLKSRGLKEVSFKGKTLGLKMIGNHVNFDDGILSKNNGKIKYFDNENQCAWVIFDPRSEDAEFCNYEHLYIIVDI